MKPQFAFVIAPGVSMSARVVPAIDANIVPRMVCGLVNLYKARSLDLMDPVLASSTDLEIASESKSPSTAILRVVLEIESGWASCFGKVRPMFLVGASGVVKADALRVRVEMANMTVRPVMVEIRAIVR